jgi:hypothetical protein
MPVPVQGHCKRAQPGETPRTAMLAARYPLVELELEAVAFESCGVGLVSCQASRDGQGSWHNVVPQDVLQLRPAEAG